ncbi:MAG: ribosomal protein L10-domain-containing protein [Monoraphidium minutum]|nr:MAG: ribosomal protein L10-domain-containing protein [Monoraphidium minutum]
MPKSKRNKVVTLNKTKKKDREWKEGLVTQVRSAVDSYPFIYVFRFHNMRNEKFKELREELKDSSRFVMGSNKMLQVALGKTDADEYRANLSALSARLKGHVGLFFTKLPRDEVERIFGEFTHEDYARPGSRATTDGPRGPMAHTLEPALRKHGLPTRLNKGVVELLADHTVCRDGQVLDPNQAALLRAFEMKMATFRFTLLAAWSAEGDAFEELAADDGGDEDEEEGGGADGGAFGGFPEGDADMMLPAGAGGGGGGDGGGGEGGDE